MFVYFPEENVQFSLGELSLGSFTNPVLLTPYSIFGVTEGDSANNVLNLVRLLMTLDGDGNPENGIQLSAAGVSQLGTLNLADFDTSPESFDGRVSSLALVGVQQARQHLLQLLQQKNNPLTVSSFLPLDNGSLATLDTSIFVEFSEPLRQSSIKQDNALTLQSGSTLVAGSLSVQNNQLSFKPSNPLSPNTSYTVTLDTNLSDQDGKPLSGTRSWTFQTGELASAPGLEVLNTSPENQATEVPLNSTLVIYFPEAVLAQSEELWILEGGGTEIACKSRVTENAVYCQPQQDLLAETVYTLTLLPKLVSESGSPLSEAFVLSFTTGTSRFSAETFLRHRGDFTDNYTNSPNITLLLSSANENSLRYQVTDQSVAPSSAGSGWQTPLGYPIEVPFRLSELSVGSKTVTAWFDDGEQLVDNFSLSLVYDPEPPEGYLLLADSAATTKETIVSGYIKSWDWHGSDEQEVGGADYGDIGWYTYGLDNLTPPSDSEDWIPLA
ncbi:MAG: hypothetical protein EBU26_17625, partial [Verrucomicrobia bacterium]|nr:hypothetical protein [Verrucomicrobiota bacterium]